MPDLNDPSVAAPLLAPAEADRLIDFARACRAAARAVALYPGGHPAIGTALGRLGDLTRRTVADGPLRLTVLPDDLRVDGRGLERSDAAVGEFAALLHAHGIGGLTIQPDMAAPSWQPFLALLGQSPEAVRAEGGFARAWLTAGGQGLDLVEIDYADVLRERIGGEPAGWAAIIEACLGGGIPIDAGALGALLSGPDAGARLAELAAQIDRRAAGDGPAARTAALGRLLAGIAGVPHDGADRSAALADGASKVLAGLPPDLVLGLYDGPAEDDGPPDGAGILQLASDEAVSRFVARAVVTDRSASARLVRAFGSLVPDDDRRRRLLRLVRDELATSPLADEEGFEDLWNDVSQLLSSYSDSPFVGDAYSRELSGAHAQAVEIDQIRDDAPAQIAGWLRTVAPSAVRTLDQRLLLDLIAIEADPGRWAGIAASVVGSVEELLLVGDAAAAGQLVGALTAEAGPAGRDTHRAAASDALDRLVGGAMMSNTVAHLQTMDDATFEQVKALYLSLGDRAIPPLADALSTEDRGRAQQRLTELLLAYGRTGRQAVERLKNSASASVRRTAAYLLRAFGGSEALADLEALLGDEEPAVQREAVRAILAIGTDDACALVGRAVATGDPRVRDRIMGALASLRQEQPAPLVAYLVRTLDHRALSAVTLRGIELLGTLGDPAGVPALGEALQRGEWWAPRRTRLLRAAAADALARIDGPEARRALDEAAAGGSRGVRAAARGALDRRRHS
ncbi:MAG: HEAT repeat domain-containing protein [Acidobacteriota bacterium]|nr:HEAT repeat domain-containing protein [Acidobacteriota bacterium]